MLFCLSFFNHHLYLGLGENWGTSKLIGATSDPGRSIHQPAPADRQQTLFGGKQLAQIAPQPQQQQQQIRELGSLILQVRVTL